MEIRYVLVSEAKELSITYNMGTRGCVDELRVVQSNSVTVGYLQIRRLAIGWDILYSVYNKSCFNCKLH
jgi:hypothetical protein